MTSLFDRLLKRGKNTSLDAKQRLKVLVMQDQVQLSPAELDQMKAEILEVIAKYVDVDETAVDFRLDRQEREVSLVSQVPVRKTAARKARGDATSDAPADATP